MVRVWATYRAGIPVGVATSSVLLDRLTALAGTIVLITLSLPLLFSLTEDYTMRFGLAVVIVAVLLGFLLLMTLDAIPGISAKWRLTRFACALAHDARRVFLDWPVALITITLSIVGLILIGTAVATLGRALGIEVSLLACCILMPPVMLMMMVPISIAGWGVRELAMVTAFGYAQVDPTDALTLSLAFGVAALVTGLPGGLLWLRKPFKVQQTQDVEGS